MGIFEDTHEGYRKLGDVGYINNLKLEGLGKAKCNICNIEFCKSCHIQKYCSDRCRWKAKYSRRNKNTIGLRFKILKRDGFMCMYCGKNPIEDKIKLQVDHIHPKSKGGLYNEDNLITSCNLCNIGKTDFLIEENKIKKIKSKLKKVTP